MLNEDSTHKRQILVHLCEVTNVVKFIDTGSRKVAARDIGRRGMGSGASVLYKEKSSGDPSQNNVNVGMVAPAYNPSP